MRGLIIAGTDTNIGKTLLSALLMTAIPEARYWKPIQSGTDGETDSQAVQRIAQCGPERIIPESYVLTQPLSPHLSARLDGVRIEPSNVRPSTTDRFLIVELAGGILVPLNDNLLQIDLISIWNLPVILATRTTLGTINHTLLSLEALRARKVEVLGTVMIGNINTENEKAIEQFGTTRLMGRVPFLETIDKHSLLHVFKQEFAPFRNAMSDTLNQQV